MSEMRFRLSNNVNKKSDSLSLKSQYFLAANTSDAISRCKGSILNWSLTIISKRGWMKLRSYLLDFASDFDKLRFLSPEIQHRIAELLSTDMNQDEFCKTDFKFNVCYVNDV